MRIIRYINGKRVSKPFDNSIIVDKNEISQAINSANRRLRGTDNRNIHANFGLENE
ncbi:MAG: hypothetical protein IKW64_04015 [Clostridia bacterium]|nr:hypothetical protein [Clostridia bacterium]